MKATWYCSSTQLPRFLILIALCAVYAVAPLGGVFAMTFVNANEQDRVEGRHADFARDVGLAVASLRERAAESETCRNYFLGLGVDLDAWLTPHEPPFAVPRTFRPSWFRNSDRVCGGAQHRPPFEVIFVDPTCFRGNKICDLASLLLHEMGHLARQDTQDNEPKDFFAACRLSACIDPGRFE